MSFRLPAAEELEHLKLAVEISKTPVDEVVVADRHHAVVNGFRIHYLDWGKAGRPPIVFLHGGALNAHTWDVVCLALRADPHCIAVDQRGHGDSEWGLGRQRACEALGEDLERVLDATLAPGERAVIAGHSLGGMTIAAWARLRGGAAGRASAVAFLNTGMGDLIDESLLLRAPTPLAAARGAAGRALLSASLPMPARSTPVAHRMTRAIAFGPIASPATVAFGERMVLECRRDVRAGCGRTLAQLDLHEAVANVDVPAVVLAGTRDRLTPPVHAERLAADLPQLVRYVKVEGSGHMTPLEQPNAVNELLVELSAAPATVAA